MKENKNPNEISQIVKSIISNSNKLKINEIKTQSINRYQKEYNSLKDSKAIEENFQIIIEEEAQFVCKNYLSKAADERRKKLYTNDDGSLCDDMIKRKNKYFRKCKIIRRNFKNKNNRRIHLANLGNKKENPLKKNLVNDRFNGVYIFTKNIDKLLQETENKLKTPEKSERL